MAITDPNWAEQTTAIAAAVSGFGLIFVLLAVIESQRTRHAQFFTDVSRRWEEDGLVETRRLIRRFKTREQLRRQIAAWERTNNRNYYTLQRELNFFEDLGVAQRKRAIRFSYIHKSLGVIVRDRWTMWEPSVRWFREKFGDDCYVEFERLAKKSRRRASARARVRRLTHWLNPFFDSSQR